jgi:hypothetical protein
MTCRTLDSETCSVRLRRARKAYRLAFYNGWIDAGASLPYGPDYDNLNEDHQLAYECGRLQRSQVNAAGLTLVWDGSARMADDAEIVMSQAARITGGDAIPPDAAP